MFDFLWIIRITYCILFVQHFFFFVSLRGRIFIRRFNWNKKYFVLEKIRVGKDYQVIVPEMGPKPEVYADKALLVWSPAREIPESKLEEYITLAKERYGYNAEQALGMLFWHKHDLEKAVTDLANFTPFPDEWSKEDKVLFEQAFQFHGKCFHRIRQMVNINASSFESDSQFVIFSASG